MGKGDTYLPFGAVTVMNSSWSTISASAYNWNYGFQDMRQDAVSGLLETLNRWYSSSEGRWLSNDPSAFDGRDVDLYRALGNNSYLYCDPSGLQGVYNRCIKYTEGVDPGACPETFTIRQDILDTLLSTIPLMKKGAQANEWGGAIILTPDGQVKITKPIEGNPNSWPAKLKDKLEILKNLKEGERFLGWYHSHPASTAPSAADIVSLAISATGSAEKLKYNVEYIIGQDGTVYVLKVCDPEKAKLCAALKVDDLTELINRWVDKKKTNTAEELRARVALGAAVTASTCGMKLYVLRPGPDGKYGSNTATAVGTKE